MNYDDNPIGVYTAYSYDELCDYRRRHAAPTRRVFLVLLCLQIVAIAVLTGLHIKSGGQTFFGWLNTLAPMLVLVGAFLLMYLSLSGLFFTKKQYERATMMARNGQSYAFCEHDFSMRNEQENAIGEARVAYSVLDRVVETPDMFYLYINKNQAYLVSKHGFRSGSPDELRALLQRYIPLQRYKQTR